MSYPLFVILALALGSLSQPAFASELPKECANLLSPFPEKNLGRAVNTEWLEKSLVVEKTAHPAVKQLRNAIQITGFKRATYNPEVLKAHNSTYTHEIPMGPITNQAQSGRCWIFAILNQIREGMIRQGMIHPDFEFSENYLHFFNMLEKSNRYFEKLIAKHGKEFPDMDTLRAELSPNAAVGDGGWFHYAVDLIAKYGLVPKSVMPDTMSAANTAALQDQLAEQLAAYGLEMLETMTHFAKENGVDQPLSETQLTELRAIKTRGMSRVVKVLVTHLGVPPTEAQEFEFKMNGFTKLVRAQKAPKGPEFGGMAVTHAVIGKFTPQSFLKATGFDPKGFVTVSGTPLRPTDQLFEQENDHLVETETENSSEFKHRILNVEMSRLEELTDTALMAGEPLWFAAQVEGVGKDIDHATGLMHTELFKPDAAYDFDPQGSPPTPTRAEEAFLNRSQANHGMALVGLDRPDLNQPTVKRKVENSWDKSAGENGIYHMYPGWFRTNVWEVIIPRRFLSPEELAKWDGKPTVLKSGNSFF